MLGNTMRCGKVLIPCHPVLARVPQLDSGGLIPKPKKLSVDSAKIAYGTEKVRVIISGLNIFGNICLKKILSGEAPKLLADSI